MQGIFLNSILKDSQAILITIDIFKIIGFLGIINLLTNSTKLISKWLSIKEYQVNTNIQNIDFELLDKIIATSFDEYVLLNGYAYADYIDNETENKINREITEIVKSRISPAILDKLSVIYNLDTISEIIARKIYIYTTAFVVEKNKPKTQ